MNRPDQASEVKRLLRQQNPDLTFHPVTPCAVVDTRVGSPFAANEIHTCNVVVQGASSAELRDDQGHGIGQRRRQHLAVRNRNANAVIEGSTPKAEGGSGSHGVGSKGPGATVALQRSVIDVTAATTISYGLSANTGETLERDP